MAANTAGETQGWRRKNRLQGREAAIAAALSALATAAFAAFASGRGASGWGLAVPSALFALFFILYPGFSVTRWTEALSAAAGPRVFIRAGAAWIVAVGLYAAYAASRGALPAAGAARTVVYGLLPLAIWNRRGDPLLAGKRLALTLALLWLPLEFGWIRGLNLPAGPGGLDVTRLLVLDLALALFVVIAPVRDLGFTFRFHRADLARAGLAYAVFAAAAVPAGLALGFLRYGPRPFEPSAWFQSLLSIYFLVAVPEELLYRGLIQNAVEKRWPGPRADAWSLGISAAIFGLSHLDNGPFPNWRYAILALGAGLAYGWVWRRSRRITVSALTHAAVDVTWVLLFRAGKG